MKNGENCFICSFIPDCRPIWISHKPEDDGLPNTHRGVLSAMYDQTDHKSIIENLGRSLYYTGF